jgi:radical SAM protein with 4Fe4S-binding SPASM domain
LNHDPTHPLFSAIMPVWNRAHRVPAAIESVLRQTCADFELLVVDDGSEDPLEETLRRFADPRVRYIRTPHHGVAAARNTGIAHARGQYIAYLDSDNSWRPEFLQRMQETFQSDPQRRSAAYALAQVHEHNGRAHPAALKVLGEPPSLRTLARHNQIDQNTLVHAKSCAQTVGGHDESLKRLVDWDFAARLVTHFAPIFVPEVLVDYNWGLEPNAISMTQDLKRAKRAVRRKVKLLMRRPRKISFHHDMVKYVWDDLPDEKYDNWLRMRSGEHDYATFVPRGQPFKLQIEPTSRCNLQCPLCPVGRNELGRPKRDMTLAEFQAILDDMRKWVMLLILWDWGEPFANPALPEMIKYAAQADMRTVTSTNAHYLNNDDYVAAILSSGLSTLIVAIDSIHDADYQAYRVGGKLERALEGLRKLVRMKQQLKSHTLINMRMVVMRQNESQVPKLRRMAREIGADRFTVKTLNPSCGSVSVDNDMVPQNKKLRRFAYAGDTWQRIAMKSPCERVMMMSNIFSNGDVVPCCYDFDASMKIGNVFQTPLSKIWVSDAYRDARRRIHEERQSLPRCQNCHINFQLSRTGWFAEATDLRRPFWDPRRYWGT